MTCQIFKTRMILDAAQSLCRRCSSVNGEKPSPTWIRHFANILKERKRAANSPSKPTTNSRPCLP